MSLPVCGTDFERELQVLEDRCNKHAIHQVDALRGSMEELIQKIHQDMEDAVVTRYTAVLQESRAVVAEAKQDFDVTVRAALAEVTGLFLDEVTCLFDHGGGSAAMAACDAALKGLRSGFDVLHVASDIDRRVLTQAVENSYVSNLMTLESANSLRIGRLEKLMTSALDETLWAAPKWLLMPRRPSAEATEIAERLKESRKHEAGALEEDGDTNTPSFTCLPTSSTESAPKIRCVPTPLDCDESFGSMESPTGSSCANPIPRSSLDSLREGVSRSCDARVRLVCDQSPERTTESPRRAQLLSASRSISPRTVHNSPRRAFVGQPHIYKAGSAVVTSRPAASADVSHQRQRTSPVVESRGRFRYVLRHDPR